MSSPRARTRVAAAGLLLASAVTSAAVPALAAGAPRPVARRDVVAPMITVTTGQTGTTLSVGAITPGNTEFDLVGKGGVDVVTFRHGYTLTDLVKDAKKLFTGDVRTVRRVDRNVVFWGGAQAQADGVQVAMELPPGSYSVVNLDKGSAATLSVAGSPEARSLPAVDSTIGYRGHMRYRAPAHLPKTGWVEFRNTSDEPHFTDLQKLKPGTTRSQVARFLASGASGRPAFLDDEFHESLVVSPGHSFQYYLDASRGEYAELCFWPSDENGMPHAFMGMFDISRLR